MSDTASFAHPRDIEKIESIKYKIEISEQIIAGRNEQIALLREQLRKLGVSQTSNETSQTPDSASWAELCDTNLPN